MNMGEESEMQLALTEEALSSVWGALMSQRNSQGNPLPRQTHFWLT